MVISTFLLYLTITIVIGIIAYRRTRDLSDYILAGRRLGPWVAALSAGASDMSAWLLLGLPGFAYASGFKAVWLVAGLALGTYINWKVIALRLRVYSEQSGDALTLPEFFSKRFEDNVNFLRIVAAVFIVVFFIFYVSAGLVAGGKLFEEVFQFPYATAVLVGAGAVIVYTFLGGFLAASWTDLFQALLMLFALVIVALMLGVANDGLSDKLFSAQQSPHIWRELFGTAPGEPVQVIAIISLLAWGLGYFGQPHILARFKAINSARQIPAARRIAMTWVLLCMISAMLVGLFNKLSLAVPLQGSEVEKIFMISVVILFHPLVAGICLAAILAAIMSTVDSQLLVSSSTLTEDFYKTFLRRQASQKELVWVGRIIVILMAVIALIIALYSEQQKVIELVGFAWAGLGAAFGPALILSLYWRRMNLAGAIAGILVGGTTVIFWHYMLPGHDLYEIVPGFILSLLSIVVVSLITGRPEVLVVNNFDRMIEQIAQQR